jgi:hypothetical protein
MSRTFILRSYRDKKTLHSNPDSDAVTKLNHRASKSTNPTPIKFIEKTGNNNDKHLNDSAMVYEMNFSAHHFGYIISISHSIQSAHLFYLLFKRVVSFSTA